jgi:ribosomal protein S18 acetylase RimI-like enzyme
VSRADGSAGASGELQVRRFQAGDALAVRQLHHGGLTAAGAHLGRGQWDQDLDSVPTTFLDDGGEFLVGLRDARLVAMGGVRHVTDTVGELKGMLVHPAFQRRGYGRLILTRLEDRAGELGYRRLRLDTMVTQTAAQRLFGSAGYGAVGRGELAGTDVIYYEKRLA